MFNVNAYLRSNDEVSQFRKDDSVAFNIQQLLNKLKKMFSYLKSKPKNVLLLPLCGTIGTFYIYISAWIFPMSTYAVCHGALRCFTHHCTLHNRVVQTVLSTCQLKHQHIVIDKALFELPSSNRYISVNKKYGKEVIVLAPRIYSF